MKPLLITGSDTGVGKTILTASLAAYWSTYHCPASLGIYKPVQSGVGDREYFQSTFDLTQTLEQINPIWFETPIAPAIAMFKEQKPLDLGLAWQQFQILQAQYECLLVEGMGGLGSPITYDYTVADLARDWHLPTVLVVSVKLGAIGQAVANVALATVKKVQLQGIVLSCSEPEAASTIDDLAPIDLIQSLTSVPVLGVLPYIADCSNLSKLAYGASQLEIERLGF